MARLNRTLILNYRIFVLSNTVPRRRRSPVRDVRMGDAGHLAALRKDGGAATMPWWCTLRSRFLLARAGAVMGAVLVAATTT